MFPTKFKKTTDSFDLRVVERFIKQKRAGFAVDEMELSLAQYEGVLYWTDLEYEYDLEFQQSLTQIAAMRAMPKI